MNELNFIDHIKFVSERIKQEIPKGGTSLLISSDNNAIFCHLMGRQGDLLNVICSCMEENESLFEIMQIAVYLIELQKEDKQLKNKQMKDIINNFANKMNYRFDNIEEDDSINQNPGTK